MKKELREIVKAIFEARLLKRIQRSGTLILLLLGDTIKENVVEHSFYAALIAIVMHHFDQKLDLGKLLIMCLTHDLEEVRTGDLNQVNRLYYDNDPEIEAFRDMWKGSKLGENLTEIHTERHKRRSKEAIAARDCDVLAEIVLEKEYFNAGVMEVKEWMDFHLKRLNTEVGKKIGRMIMSLNYDSWWEEVRNKIRKMHGQKEVDYKKFGKLKSFMKNKSKHKK